MRTLRVIGFLVVLGALSAPVWAFSPPGVSQDGPRWVPATRVIVDPFPLQSATQPAISSPPMSTNPPELKPSTKPAVAPTAAKPPAPPKTYNLSPVEAFRSQPALDDCKLVLWMANPTFLIAGHNHCGYQWLDKVPTGSLVVVTGFAKGTYRVVGHKWIASQGGTAPAWIGDYDLILQTCRGSGTGFSLAKRVS